MNLIARLKALVNRLLPRASFARSVGVLVGGTAGSQALLVLASPLLTRLYTPDDFGLLAVYAGLLSLFGVIASFRYELAITLPEDDQSAANLTALSLLLVLVVSAISGLLVLIAGSKIALLLGAPGLAAYLWLLPIGVLMAGFQNALRYWALRKKAFGISAAASIKQSVTNVLIQIIGYPFGSISLLLGQAGSQVAGTLAFGKLFLSNPNKKQINWKEIKTAAVRYKRFPLYSTWEGLFNTAGTQLPPLLFAALFSPAAAGLYSLANRVLSLPMSLIGSAIGQVFLSNAAQAHREGTLGKLVLQLHTKLAQVGLPPAMFLIFAAPDLFEMVFGVAWREAGEFSRWMIPWLYLVFVTSPLSTLFAVMEKQKQGMAFQVILLIARLIAIYFGFLSGEIIKAIILFSLSSAVCWLGLLMWIGSTSKNKFSDMLSPSLRALGISILCVAPLILAMQAEQDSIYYWRYAIIASGALIAARLISLLKKAYQ